jgi:hypothetical protein
MPFDPNSAFDPTDPSQWWRLRDLSQIPVQPKAPPRPPSGNSAGDDGPDDWFVPEADGYPNDWIYPHNNAPAAAPSTAPPPSSQRNPAVNRAPERFDPYHAYCRRCRQAAPAQWPGIHRSFCPPIDQFRSGGSLEHEMPTNAQYREASRRALIASGFSEAQASELEAQAAAQRAEKGLSESKSVPNIPIAIWRRKRK